MTSDEYRKIIKTIAINSINKNFPGLKRAQLEETGNVIAKNIHARMYGANVDNVDSPIWSVNRNGEERIEKALASHPDGSKIEHQDNDNCKCKECKEKRRKDNREYMRTYRANKLNQPQIDAKDLLND